MTTALAATIGSTISIILITRKSNPAYSLIAGAIIGGLLGGLGLDGTVKNMIEGVKDVSPAVIRILAAGVLSGVLIKTGAASRIAHGIVSSMGEKRVFFALALSTLILCSIGVFIDVAVITVAPIALSVGKSLRIPKTKLLLALIGGGKCGNIISPNPNTIIAAENMGADLSAVMIAGIPAAIVGMIVVLLLVRCMKNEGEVYEGKDEVSTQALPTLWASLLGPIVAVGLLSLRPLAGIHIDPLIALPLGGICSILATRKTALWHESIAYGLEKMSAIAVLLISTGALAGIIKCSDLKEVILGSLARFKMSESLIAPVAGALMSAATASTTAGATIASSSFADVILASGMSAVSGAALINAGSTVFDHLPHGSFFHATAGACYVPIGERLKLIGYESLIGLSLTTVGYLVFSFT